MTYPHLFGGYSGPLSVRAKQAGRAGPSASRKCTSTNKTEFAMHKDANLLPCFFFFPNGRRPRDDALKSRTARSRGAAGTCHISRRISNDSLLPV